jgi:hypothetical protein
LNFEVACDGNFGIVEHLVSVVPRIPSDIPQFLDESSQPAESRTTTADPL